jgi:hypothetical protein
MSRAKPLPAFKCGKQGTTTDPGWLDRFQACDGDDTSCYNACAKNALCVSYAYNRNNNFCRLFSKTLNEKGYQPSETSGIYHWNLNGCFVVPDCAKPTPTSSSTVSTPTSTPTPPADPVNLLSNPSFETTTTGGDPSDSFVADWYTETHGPVSFIADAASPSDPASAQDGTNFVQLTIDAGSNSVTQTVTGLDTSGNTWYNLVFYMRTDSIGIETDPCDVFLQFGGLEPARIPLLPPLHSWGTVTMGQLTPDAADQAITVRLDTCGSAGGSAIVGLDNFVLTAGPATLGTA